MMIPKHTTLANWAASLIIDFPDDDVPQLEDESKWREWGDSLVLSPTFAVNNSPDTKYFKDWEQWAQRVFDNLSNEA